MAAAITLVMFATNVGISAGQPRKAIQNLNLSLTPKSDKIDDDNAGVFADANNRAANLNIQNLAPETLALFMAAPRVRVTVEIIED